MRGRLCEFFFSSRRRHTRLQGDWSSDVCSSDLGARPEQVAFVRNTSDALSTVANGLDWRVGDNIVTFSREFPSNIYPRSEERRVGNVANIWTSRVLRFMRDRYLS